MTHDILQSDIDLATRLIGDARPDAEIVEALVRRSVDPAKAAQVVIDLRRGQRVIPFVHFAGVSRLEPVHEEMPQNAERAGARRAHGERATGAVSGAPRSRLSWVVVGVLIVLGIAAGIVISNRVHRAKADIRDDAAEAGNGSVTSVEAEIDQDGLRIQGKRITRENALRTLSKAIGAATRTNVVNSADKIVYAFDAHGILVYSQKDTKADSVLLDFDGNGGTNGTQAPFRGALKVDAYRISAETDSETLPSIKQLELDQAKTGTGFFGGRCKNLDISFAYLKTPQRLSLIEIDLK